MSEPSFNRSFASRMIGSRYANDVDLYKAKAEYYEKKCGELEYLVSELDAHEGAEGWSAYLEKKLVKFRKEKSDE